MFFSEGVHQVKDSELSYQNMNNFGALCLCFKTGSWHNCLFESRSSPQTFCSIESFI